MTIFLNVDLKLFKNKIYTFILDFQKNLNLMNIPGFIEEKILGKGSYGCVYKAKRISDGQSYAIKVINLKELRQREIIDSVNEIRLMASLASPYIITFYQAFYDNKRLCIVTEYSRLGDLAHLIYRRKSTGRPFKENDIWRYLIQILEGLKVMHTANVVHRDIKSANILISAPDLVKIGDLGISTVLHHYPHYTQMAKTQIGTPLYIAPEIWKKRQYDSKCDIWSLGVLLYEMMTFDFPFKGRNDRELTQRVCSGYFVLPKGYSSDLISVLRRLLQVNPNNRPSVNDLLNLKCIKDRVHLINKSIISGYDDDLRSETIRKMIQPSPSDGCLLSTIKLTHNMRNIKFPQPMYGKRVNIVKPLEQRMQLKQGIPVKKDIRQISSPEFKVICDRDWWTPIDYSSKNNKNYQQLVEQEKSGKQQCQKAEHKKEEAKPKQDEKENQTEQNVRQKLHPQRPQVDKIQLAPRPIYKVNNENNDPNNMSSNDEKNSNKSDQPISPSSSSYKSDSSADSKDPNSAGNTQKRLLSIGNGKIKIPEGRKGRHQNPRVRKYRYHKFKYYG